MLKISVSYGQNNSVLRILTVELQDQVFSLNQNEQLSLKLLNYLESIEILKYAFQLFQIIVELKIFRNSCSRMTSW